MHTYIREQVGSLAFSFDGAYIAATSDVESRNVPANFRKLVEVVGICVMYMYVYIYLYVYVGSIP
jgi:hypothetical protein